MNNVSWCLMAVSFGLGLLLTLAFLVRRVKREVPVHGSDDGAASLTGATGSVKAPTAKVPKADVPDVSGADAATAAAAGAGGVAAAKFVGTEAGSEPYGAGSIRLAAGAEAPSGWTVKGNEDSMLYHTPESPSYEQTVAELWFRDVESAEDAGFARWDSGRSQRDQK